ncbi:MAG: nitrite reductase small subunit NirD [Gammaproteobacteria bacterium]|nr:nitrite reductase small subunit NirD [Gammaproteobacteria bacterium]
MSQTWIKVGALDDIPRLGARVIRGPRVNIAVFRTGNDEVFALEDRCPHKGGPLSQGIVFGRRVACPLHEWVLELKTGDAVAPDIGCTRAYPVRIDDGIIWLSLVAQRRSAADCVSAVSA